MNDNSAPAPVDRPAAIAGFVLLGTVAVLSFIVQPALVHGFVTELGLSEEAAVSVAGVEMAGVALGSIAVAAIGGRADWRVLTGLAIAVAVVGNLLSAGFEGGWFGPARFVAGLGHGALIGLSFAFVGLTRRTDRNLALYLVSLLSYGAVGIWAAPMLFRTIGLPGIFLAFAAITLASALVLPLVPRSADARGEASPTARQLGFPMLAAALAGVLAYNLAQGIAWAVLFLVGMAAGMAEQAVADALFLSQVLAVGGALAALALAHRVRRGVPIVVGIVGGGACIALLPGQPAPLTFLVAVCGFNILWNFVLPFILGAVGDMDLKGRMMAPAIAMQMIGLGLGPLLSAALVGEGKYDAVEWLCVGFFAASLVLLALPLRAAARA